MDKRPISKYKRGCASGFRFIQKILISSFLHKCPLLSSYFLFSLVRTSPKIVRISLILGQGPRNRYKEDKETRKVEIGRLGGEERSSRVLVPEKFLEKEF